MNKWAARLNKNVRDVLSIAEVNASIASAILLPPQKQ